MKKDFNLVFIIGVAYMGVEVAYSAITGGSWSLVGKSSLWMLLVGGFTGFGLGLLNEKQYVLNIISYRGRVLLGALSIKGGAGEPRGL